MMTAGPFGGPMSNNDGPMGQRMPGNDVGMGRPPPSREQSNKIDEFFQIIFHKEKLTNYIFSRKRSLDEFL